MLKFADRMVQGPYYHLTTVEWARNRIPGYHCHDYSEVFWLTNGRCKHLINNELEILEKGTLMLIRAEDAHSLRPVSRGDSFEFTNLAIAPLVFARLKKAYPKEHDALYRLKHPFKLQLNARGMEQLSKNMLSLASEPHTIFSLETAILQLWKLCLPVTSAPRQPQGEDWLLKALIKLEEPEIMSAGVAGLVEATGRSHAHVSRRCRETTGKTPTQLVNEARMKQAAHWLRTSALSVLEIAMECGFENPSHFHRLFKAKYGVSPRKFRSL